MTWLPGVAKRTRLVERLTKLGTTLPGEGDARYYSFQSYSVSEGMELHGTLDDIFKDAPRHAPLEPVVSEVQADEKSELARVTAELQECKSQLAQAIGLVQVGRESTKSGSLQDKEVERRHTLEGEAPVRCRHKHKQKRIAPSSALKMPEA